MEHTLATPNEPRKPDKSEVWIYAETMANWLRDNPLIDYLEMHGQWQFDRDVDVEGYEEEFDLDPTFARRSGTFAQAVIKELGQRWEVRDCDGPPWRSDLRAATLEAMVAGVPIIAHGEVGNADLKVWGRIDMLIRADPRLPEDEPLKGGTDMTRISSVQQGVIGQQMFSNYAILGSNGLLVPAAPIADDDRRDFEIHIKRNPRLNLPVQVKTTTTTHHSGGKPEHISIFWWVRKDRLISDDWLWYCFELIDLVAMDVRDPLYLAPSTVVHKLAAQGMRDNSYRFNFMANLNPKSHDQWVPWRVNRHDLGQRLLSIIESLPCGTRPSDEQVHRLLADPSVLWARHDPTEGRS
jgi:hypothetical protein